MAQVTRENIRSQFRGERLMVVSPEHEHPLVGHFVRTNVVVDSEGEYLYVTLNRLDGQDPEVQRVFDIDRALVFNKDVE